MARTSLGLAVTCAWVFASVLCTTRAMAFPQIQEWQAKPLVVYDNKREVTLKKALQLKSPFAVVTANEDSLGLVVNSFDHIRVYPKSKIQVPDFENEHGLVSDLYLLDGKIRLTSTFRGVNKQYVALNLKTPFFEFRPESLVDMVVELNMKVPSIEIWVLEGTLPLKFFEYEKNFNLKAGEKIRFIGELNDEKSAIRYDYLLNDRKVPKGKATDVELFSVDEFLKEERLAKQAADAKRKELLRQEQERQKKKKAHEASFLCKNPFGQKDQCSWRLEGGKCFRQRCNVSGQWGDKTERPINGQCKKEFHVTQCDY
ncbi:hypothetical protein [Pseudobdellovibrio exovorus]|uniref:Uncharacterized protein n=1 Tax=Pseudobdellovibrio exovorus JSS TaxID=1184267 RepID=M4VC99_9BACT|nr:hypothetical protein [Pseudobdellovibrio exovorus]AGH95661.1 hypothetical protein A11Q_1445 [Pseudobdellovibrio exovorus JSS]